MFYNVAFLGNLEAINLIRELSDENILRSFVIIRESDILDKKND